MNDRPFGLHRRTSRMTIPCPPPRRGRLMLARFALLLLAVCAAVAASTVGTERAAGEEGSDTALLPDLVVSIKLNSADRSSVENYITVANGGPASAYDVEVVFSSSSGIPFLKGPVPVGTYSGVYHSSPSSPTIPAAAIIGLGDDAKTWEIDHIPPYTGYTIRILRRFSPRRITEYAVTASTPHPEMRTDNNSAKAWDFEASTTRKVHTLDELFEQKSFRLRQLERAYVVRAAVGDDDSSQTVTITAQGVYQKGCVYIWLDSGITEDTSRDKLIHHTRPGSVEPQGLSYHNSGVASVSSQKCAQSGGRFDHANGVFVLGGAHMDGETQPYEVALDLPVTGNAAADPPQCVTAEIVGIPQAGVGPQEDNPKDNVSRVCPWEKPPFLLQEGGVNLRGGDALIWTLHACKDGVVANQCDTAPEVEIDVALSILLPLDEGSHEITRETVHFRDHTALILIKDMPSRVFDANSGSVTNGSTVSWQTKTDADPDFTGTRQGVKVALYREPVNDYIQNWTNYDPTIKAIGLNGGNPPGKVSFRSPSNGVAYWALTSDNSWTSKRANPFRLTRTSTAATYINAEFETLGTYLVDFDVDVKHATIDDDSNGETDVFKGTGRTIFHVGPIADLGVKDDGISRDAGAAQVAFTVAGFNYLEEAPESGKVVVTLPTGTTGLTTLPANTGVFDGNASPPTWTWDIHELERGLASKRALMGYYPAADYRQMGETVSLIVDGVAAGAKAKAKIHYDPYEVCVASDGTNAAATTETACNAVTGASWHSGTVYDVDQRNNSAILTARAGVDPKDAPTLETMGSPDSIIVLKWEPVPTVNGWPVSHYQVQKWVEDEEDWEDQEPEKVLTPLWVDTDPGEDPQYRARAVNGPGRPGTWSEPIFGDQNTAADAEVEVDLRPNTAGIHRTLRVDEGDEIEYTIKLKSRPSFVVHVQVEADDSLTVITPPPPDGVPPLPNAENVVTFHPADFDPAEREATKRVKVRVNDDLVIAAPRTAKIRHKLPTTGGINRSAGYGGLTVPELTLTVDDTTVEKAGFASLGEKTLLLAAGETQSYEIRPLVKPTADLTITLTSSNTAVATIDDTDPDTDGNQSAITFRPGDFRAELDTETLPGTEFYAVPVNSPGPGVVSVTAVGAGDANITITAVGGDTNFSTTKGAASQAVKVGATKPVVTAPEFSTPPEDQTATVGAAFSYAAPAATDAQNDTITYAAALTDGSPLPGWLTFTASTRTFAGTPEVCDGPSSLTVAITATDYEAPIPDTGAASFTLTVNGASGGPAWHETVSAAYYEEYARENGHLGEGGNPAPAYYNRPPLFLDGASITLELAENSAADVKVGEPLTACDPDGSSLLYKWLDGEDGAAFSLDEDTGQLTTKSGQTYDYDTDPSYEFLVIVEEQGSVEGYLSAISVTVNVSDDD